MTVVPPLLSSCDDYPPNGRSYYPTVPSGVIHVHMVTDQPTANSSKYCI